MNISVRKTVARLVVCSAIILQCIEKVTVYYCGLQVVPYLTCMLCWLHVSRCSQKLKKKEWQLFPDWLPSHQNMYVFLFSPICYICLYEFMMKKIAKWEFVADCLHFCYSFTGNKKKGRGWLLIYRGMSCAVICGWKPGRAGSTNHGHFFVLTCGCTNGKDHIKQWELIIRLPHFLPKCLLFGSLGEQKVTVSQIFSSWIHSCCYLMRVITYMKTVARRCSVCVQQSSCHIQWEAGLWRGFLFVSKSFSTRGLITSTNGIWHSKRWGEVHPGEIRVVPMGETWNLWLFE